MPGRRDTPTGVTAPMTNKALATGEISRPRLDRGAPAADADVELVPAVLRHARWRVAHQIALAEFVKDAEECRGEIGGLLDLEQAAAGQRRHLAQKLRLEPRRHRHRVDHH